MATPTIHFTASAGQTAAAALADANIATESQYASFGTATTGLKTLCNKNITVGSELLPLNYVQYSNAQTRLCTACKANTTGLLDL